MTTSGIQQLKSTLFFAECVLRSRHWRDSRQTLGTQLVRVELRFMRNEDECEAGTSPMGVLQDFLQHLIHPDVVDHFLFLLGERLMALLFQQLPLTVRIQPPGNFLEPHGFVSVCS